MATHVDKLNFDLHKPDGVQGYQQWLQDNIVPPAVVLDVWYGEGLKQPIVLWVDDGGGGGGGAQGPMGPQGFVGSQGIVGPQGVTGSGFQGFQGPVGVWG